MATNETVPVTTHALVPGQSPPFTVITETDRSGILLIAISLGLVAAFVFTLIRLFIRMEFNARLAKDDIASFVSMVTGLDPPPPFKKLLADNHPEPAYRS